MQDLTQIGMGAAKKTVEITIQFSSLTFERNAENYTKWKVSA